jgi:hypothetical protein
MIHATTVVRAHRGLCLVCGRDLSELLADTTLVPVQMALYGTPKPSLRAIRANATLGRGW